MSSRDVGNTIQILSHPLHCINSKLDNALSVQGDLLLNVYLKSTVFVVSENTNRTYCAFIVKLHESLKQKL